MLPSGPVPPNPAELLSLLRSDAAIEKLKEDYDYIFIDSASVGSGNGYFGVGRISDATVYVCRMDYSSKG